jgi:hypothetical protein
MIIINNVSSEDWSLILSALKSEYRNSTLNEIFPKRKEKVGKLIKKIEGFNNDRY